MCQATVYLDGKEIMRDVISVELRPDGVELATFFEEPCLIPARIQKIDLIKHRILLESREGAGDHE